MSQIVINELPKNVELDLSELNAVHGGSRGAPESLRPAEFYDHHSLIHDVTASNFNNNMAISTL